jgi:hypothetical protein
MSLANRLWGAPRIHGELLKLGVEVAQSTVAKYMGRGRGPSQTWKAFLVEFVQRTPPITMMSGRISLLPRIRQSAVPFSGSGKSRRVEYSAPSP